MAITPKLGIREVEVEDVLKFTIINDAFNVLDAVIQLQVENQTTTTPPVGASDGDAYIVGVGAINEWNLKDKQVAYWYSGQWNFIVPIEGLEAYDKSLQKIFIYTTGNNWEHQLLKIPRSFFIPAGNFINESGASRVTAALTNFNADSWVLRNGFDDSISTSLFLPKHANHEGINVRLYSTNTTNGSGNLRFNLNWYNTENGESLDSATSVTQSFTHTLGSNNAKNLILSSSSQHNLHADVTENSILNLVIEREGLHVDDTFDQPINLLGVNVEYREKLVFDTPWS